MDRIGGPGFLQPFQPRKDEGGARKTRRPDEAKRPGFLDFLKRGEAEPDGTAVRGAGPAGPLSEAELAALLDQVYEAGQDLARNPHPESVVRYKTLVGRFIRVVVDGSVEIAATEGRLRKDMKKPKYALLHVVDEKLDKLGAYVLQNQKDHLEILRRVDELHGLLVDLRH